jgi:hypothetical protein
MSCYVMFKGFLKSPRCSEDQYRIDWPACSNLHAAVEKMNAPSYLYPHRCFTDIFKVFKVAESMFSGGVSPCATTLQAKQSQRTIPEQGYQIELSTCSVQQNVTNEAAHTYAIGREPCLLRYMLLQSFPRWVTSRYNIFGWRHFQKGALRTSIPIAAPRCAQKHNRLDAYCG